MSLKPAVVLCARGASHAAKPKESAPLVALPKGTAVCSEAPLSRTPASAYLNSSGCSICV